MSHYRLCVLGRFLLAGIVGGASITQGRPSAASQAVAAADASIQKRLDSIRADLFSRPDRINDAIRELKQILAVNPGSAEGHLLLGIAYRSLPSAEFAAEVRAELLQALALNPELVHARYYLARVYLDLGRAQKAREELETALAKVPGQPQFLALLGEAERQLGNPRRSLEMTRQALKADGSFAEARYYLALALIDLQQRDEAVRELERVVQSGAQVADVSLSLGGAYLEAGRLEEAIGTLAQGARIDPARPDIRIRLARAYRSKGLLDKADEQLKLAMPGATAVQATPAYQQLQSDFHQEQGLVRLQQKRLAAAVEAFQQALNMDPNNGPTHRHLAEAYLLQGLYAQSLEHAVRAEKLGSPLPQDKRKVLEDKLRPKEAP